MPETGDLQLTIYNAIGEKVYQSGYPEFKGAFSKEIFIDNATSGLYLLKVQHKDQILFKRFAVKN